jgi:hypothetical protein
MSCGVNLNSSITTSEVPATNGTLVDSSRPVRYNGLDTQITLNATSTPPVDTDAFNPLSITTSATIDMTALVGTNGAAITLNGKKPRAVKLQCPAANTNPITIAKGDSNGYVGFGSSFSITLNPGDEILLYLPGNSSAVGGSNKTLDVSCTGTQVLNYGFVGGS